MTQRLSHTDTLVLGVLEANPKGAFNASQVQSRITGATLSRDSVYKSLLRLVQMKMALQPSKGKFAYAKPKASFTGTITFNRHGQAFFVPETRAENQEDIRLSPSSLNGALPGDLVVLDSQHGKRKQNYFVQRIVKRSVLPVTGDLDVFEGTAWLLPDKGKFPYDIKLTHKVPSELDGSKASVRIVRFAENARNPEGELIEILGARGTNDAEMHAIVAEFGFRVSFPAEIENELKTIPDEVPQNAEWPDRRDFRDVFTITIDPADAKDFDDAISIRFTETGKTEVGVHIADVSHYVEAGSALDREALARGTSVYLVDRTIPMLPEKLSNDLCSLKPETDRLAFSVVFQLDDHAAVSDVWYGKTVIHSNRRFSYEEAQEIISKGEGEHSTELLKLNALAKKLNRKRFADGSLSFESDEVKFRLDEAGKPLEVVLKKRFDAHKLIAEYMLLANRLVARHVKEEIRPARPYIYRSHDAPAPDKLLDFVKFSKLMGYTIDISNDHRLRKTLNEMLEAVKGKPEEDLMSQAAIRSMAKAIYTGKRSDHFGLAFHFYTHFTSPIRRYPDLLAHRLLFAYLNKCEAKYTEDEIEKISVLSSGAEQKAAEAERASVKYKMAEYISAFKGKVFEAVVSGVTSWGVYAEIVENHCEGLIRVSELNGDHFVFIEGERKMRGLRTGRTFKAGDLISVRVKSADPQKRQIDFYLED